MHGNTIDRGRMTDEQRALAADPAALELARRVAVRFSQLSPWLFDEFLSAAHMGVIAAAMSFDPAAGASFRTYAAHQIRGSCMDAFRRSRPIGYRRVKGGLPFEIKTICSTDNWRYANDFHPKYHDEPCADEIDEVEWATATLPARNREIVRRYFTVAGVTMATEARRVGLTKTGVSMAVKASLATVRERLESRGA